MLKKLLEKKVKPHHLELQLEHGAATHIGGRDINADSFTVNQKKKLFIVADGVGDRLGKLASWFACHTVGYSFKPTNPKTLLAAALKAHEKLQAAEPNWKLDQDEHSAGMPVTTLTALHFGKNNTGHFVHAGDSSIYRFRNGSLDRLTTPKNPSLQPIGGQRKTKPQVKTIEVRQGDVFLLCTDGVTGNEVNPYLQAKRDEEIKKVLLKTASGEKSPKETAQHLATRYLTDFSDSRTAIVVKVKTR